MPESRVVQLRSRRRAPVGAIPGTLVFTPTLLPPRVHAFRYGPDSCEELDSLDPSVLKPSPDDKRITWVDIQGMGDEAFLREIGKVFGLHPLALADVVNASQRPKIEEYPGQLLFITRMARVVSEFELDIEQVGIVRGSNFVLTFQEHYGDNLDPVRQRIRESRGQVRHSGTDYLAYAILDTNIDGYFPVIESLGETIAALEEQVLIRPTQATLARLNIVKGLLIRLRRALWPQWEALNRLIRDGSQHCSADVRLYLRDTDDHCAQLVDVVDSHREAVTSLMNMYMSVLSLRTNEVMKVLTIMASIFIPLTFVVGIYGMNFHHMPELDTWWGYPAVMSFMALVAGGLLFMFWRRGWIGRRRR